MNCDSPIPPAADK